MASVSGLVRFCIVPLHNRKPIPNPKQCYQFTAAGFDSDIDAMQNHRIHDVSTSVFYIVTCIRTVSSWL